MIRFSKYPFVKGTQIIISGLNSDYEKMRQIIALFHFDFAIMTIDSLEFENSFLKIIKECELEYVVSSNNVNTKEVSVKMPRNSADFVLKKAIDVHEYPENIFFFNSDDCSDWKQMLRISPEERIKKGLSDFFLHIALDENEVSIILRKEMNEYKQLIKKIKAFI